MGTILKLATHKLVVLALGLVALGAAVGGGIALATSDAPEPLAAPAATAVPAELSAHFAVLNEGAAGSSDVGSAGDAAVGSATVTRLDESTAGLAAQFGLNPSLAREVTYGKTQHVWVIPGSKGVCIHDFETGQGTCGPTGDAIAGTLQLDVGGSAAGGGTIYGLVANGNPLVVVHDANGGTEDVPVEHNVYIVTHPGTTTVGLVNGAGQVQTVTVPK